MKALHVMYVYWTRGVGGAAAAATRLHLRMREQGADSRVVCVWKGDVGGEEVGVGSGSGSGSGRVVRRELILDPVFRRMNNEECRMNNCGRDRPLIVLFGCKDGRSNPDKGFPLLEQALALLPVELQKKIELRIFGEDEKDNIRCPPPPVFSTFLGRIDDPERLRDEYCAADCFAFPSTSETMGMTKLEALACGCPVVAFDRTACAEGIVHLQTGYIAKDGDLADYAQGLIYCLKNLVMSRS